MSQKFNIVTCFKIKCCKQLTTTTTTNKELPIWSRYLSQWKTVVSDNRIPSTLISWVWVLALLSLAASCLWIVWKVQGDDSDILVPSTQWEMRLEVLAPGFSLSQHSCVHLGNEPAKETALSLSVSLSLSLSLLLLPLCLGSFQIINIIK